jgi:hypothetical protein
VRRRSWRLPLAGLGMAGLAALMLLVFWRDPTLSDNRPSSGQQTDEPADSSARAKIEAARMFAASLEEPLVQCTASGDPATDNAELSIPSFCDTPGGIVLTVRAGADDELLQTHRALCAALLKLNSQTVRCVELPRSGIRAGDLLDCAAEAGASLVARLEGDHELHLLPAEAAAGILSELPTIHAAALETQRLLPGILDSLSHALAGDVRFDELRTPPVNTDAVGWRLATLAWYLNVLGRNQDVIPPRDIRSTMGRCRETVSIGDVSCALAHYVYAQLEPTPPDARRWLEELQAHGPQAFKELAEVELAEDDCMHEPERAQATLLRLAARWADDPCRRVALIGAATCLLTRVPRSHPDVRRLAYPEEEQSFRDFVNDIAYKEDEAPKGCPRVLHADSSPFLLQPQCAVQVIAAVIAERGQWNMRAHNWDQAVRDFEEAWLQGNHPIDLLRWAESVLHRSGSKPDCGPWPKLPCVDEISPWLDLRYFDETLLLRAAFVRWLATHDAADAAEILRLYYSDTPVHEPVIMDDERRLAELVCARPKRAECRAYRILTRPKWHGAEEQLRRLLLPADEHRTEPPPRDPI